MMMMRNRAIYVTGHCTPMHVLFYKKIASTSWSV
jgi:hypothetical protein